jgi:tetratricopeptide (TPR) repeat protein
MRYLILLVFFLSGSIAFSQGTDQQLANLYYQNGEYEKAVEYFAKIINRQSSKYDVLRYAESLEKTGDLKSTEKLLKKYVEQTGDVDYRILLAEFYERSEKPKDAAKIYDGLISEASKSGYSVVELYNAFRVKQKNDLALRALEAGRKELKKSYPLNAQFAELYYALGRTDEMFIEYFEMLEDYPQNHTMIEAQLSRQIDFAEDKNGVYAKLRESLLEKIRKKPDETVYAEMLIWLFIQKKEFKSALVQAQALDRREKSNGERVLDLGATALENSDYEAARKAYQYVIDKGPESPYYHRAYSSLLNVRYREITFERRSSQPEIAQAVSEYRKAIDMIGWNRNAVSLARELAVIQAYYGSDAESAQNLLDSCLQLPGLTDMQRAEIKMSLADVLVLRNDIWQASLYYMQIDSDFKYETIGHEAKFKNARIFYYDGDFKFAQSQLDVLKQSTSKFIANDAMKLSILITDNLGLDSNYTAMYLFSQADLALEQHQYSTAFALYDSIQAQFPYHGLADEILLRRSQAMQQQGNWQEAVAYLELIVSNYRDDILADDAVFQLGDIYEHHLNDREKAAEYYKKILFDYKGSLLTVEARKRFRAIRGDAAAEEEG